MRRQYEGVDDIILTIDGLQPEKGHETLYVVRELTQKRVWFAVPLLSATAPEVQRLIAQAKQWAEILGKRVILWVSDKQDAFVTGIAAEFPEVPHRYCDNHFLRDAAKPVLDADSHAKVQMRKKVRGLRGIERSVLKQRRQRIKEEAQALPQSSIVIETVNADNAPVAEEEPAGDVILEYCTVVRGILNDDQGGPLHPPGLRMAEALGEVRDSIQRNLDEKKGFPEEQLNRLAGCIDRGLDAVKPEQEVLRKQVEEIQEIAGTLDPKEGNRAQRQAQFQELIERFVAQGDSFHEHLAKVMSSFQPGLFAGGDEVDQIRDNLDLGRRFRLLKGHERRIHGHKHAGVRIVQEGSTTALALDAHRAHRGLFTVDDLLPYRSARMPECQRQAMNRRKIMRKARSKTKRPKLLVELERRYRACSSRV